MVHDGAVPSQEGFANRGTKIFSDREGKMKERCYPTLPFCYVCVQMLRSQSFIRFQEDSFFAILYFR
jgi:hypothetical protein